MTEEQAFEYQAAMRRLPRELSSIPGGADALEVYAVERARWREAEAHLANHGPVLVLRTDKGEVSKVVEAPELKVAGRASAACVRLAVSLGLLEAGPKK